MAVKGKFEDSEGNEYNYKVTDWFDLYGKRHKAGNYTSKDFYHTDRVWVESQNTETGEKRYTTVMGPFDDSDFIENILEYDYSEYSKK